MKKNPINGGCCRFAAINLKKKLEKEKHPMVSPSYDWISNKYSSFIIIFIEIINRNKNRNISYIFLCSLHSKLLLFTTRDPNDDIRLADNSR